MAQTPEGVQKAKNTIISKYGEGYYGALGAIGGKAKNPNKGFGGNRTLARKAGTLGGKAKAANRKKQNAAS